MHVKYVALHEMTWCHGCMVYTERAETAAVSYGTIYDSALVNIQKRAIKSSHSCRITCELSESAGERENSAV